MLRRCVHLVSIGCVFSSHFQQFFRPGVWKIAGKGVKLAEVICCEAETKIRSENAVIMQ